MIYVLVHHTCVESGKWKASNFRAYGAQYDDYILFNAKANVCLLFSRVFRLANNAGQNRVPSPFYIIYIHTSTYTSTCTLTCTAVVRAKFDRLVRSPTALDPVHTSTPTRQRRQVHSHNVGNHVSPPPLKQHTPPIMYITPRSWPTRPPCQT